MYRNPVDIYVLTETQLKAHMFDSLVMLMSDVGANAEMLSGAEMVLEILETKMKAEKE